jgi:hypothetical protein
VAFEFAILLAVPWWRAFRIAIAAAVLFHLGVYLAMDIDFSFNVVVYGAFVSWAALTQSRRFSAVVKRGTAVSVTLIAVLLGGTAWFVTSTTPTVGAVSGVAIVLAGAAIAIGYLLRQAALAMRPAEIQCAVVELPQ